MGHSGLEMPTGPLHRESSDSLARRGSRSSGPVRISEPGWPVLRMPARFLMHTRHGGEGWFTKTRFPRKLATLPGGWGGMPESPRRSLIIWVRPGALGKLGPPSLARSSKKILDPWSFEAWKLGDLRAWRFGCLEAWTELGGLDAWKLGDLESHSRMPRRGRRIKSNELFQCLSILID